MARGRQGTGNTERDVPGVALLYKAFRVLDAVAEARQPPRIADLLQMTDLSKGTLYRLLQALVDRRYLRVDPTDQTYLLGTHLFDLAHSVWASFDLRSAAAPELIGLRDGLGETVRLAVLDNYHVLYIDQADAMRELRVSSAVGNRVPVHTSSAGKAMLAALEPVHRAEILSRLSYDKLTTATIDSEDQLRGELDLVAARGYATSVDERSPGISSVAAAIVDANGRPIGALSVTGPSLRLAPDQLHSAGRDLIDAARRVAGNAGMYTEPFSVSTSKRPKVDIPPEVSCALEFHAMQGEGPLWAPDENLLYWVDILGPSLHVLDPAHGLNRTIPFPWMLSAIAQTDDGRLAVITRRGVHLLDPHSNRLVLLANPEARLSANRLNDAKVDRKGRLWVGSMAIDTTPGRGSLYRIRGDGTTKLMDSGFSISNGIAWSPDDTCMYFIDSAAGRIYRYPFDLESGELGERRVLVQFPGDTGRPGGLTVDAEGYLWVAHYDGWSVVRYDPNGRIVQSIALPIPRPTSCIFGGPNLNDLYVSSARIRLSAERIAEAPLSGSVFRIAGIARGLPEPKLATLPGT